MQIAEEGENIQKPHLSAMDQGKYTLLKAMLSLFFISGVYNHFKDTILVQNLMQCMPT